MKRKNDDLLRLAFGELSADQARAVEAQALGDASARAELEALRDLRVGLQNLPPPPPDNLSAERLRAAILDRDLRQRRPTVWNWSWAPLAVAAAAAFVFVSRPRPVSEPTILTMDDIVRKDAPRDAPAYKFLPVVKDSIVPPPVEASVATKKVAVAEEPSSRLRKTHRHAARPAPMDEEEPTPYAFHPTLTEDGGMTLASIPSRPQTMAAPMSIVRDLPATDAGSSSDSVVLVSAKRDLDTGANAATETEAGNVLIGG